MTLAAVTLGLALAPGANASTLQGDSRGTEVSTCPAASAADSPFDGVRLNGLKAVRQLNWPGPPCPVYVWTLVLDDERRGQHYSGGQFFLYSPGTGRFGGFINGDVMFTTVSDPGLVSFADVRSHRRTEVRYGDPENPRRARLIASATLCG